MQRILPVATAALVVAVLVGQGRTAPAPVPVRSCARAVLVDGLLRCDAEAPADLEALCGPGHRRVPVLAGDAIDRDVVCGQVDPDRHGPGWGRMAAEDLKVLGQPVDLNDATVAELRSLPRVGPKIARRIVQGRPYGELDDLLHVKGIGPKTLERLRDRAVVIDPLTLDAP